ncbi:MAG: hypothetical protein IBJ10_09980 [Phycisphaerales bacterium]|nr:hypothetical protein [Phycisphaerales bacterium]
MASRAVTCVKGAPVGAAWEVYRVPCGQSAVVSVAAFNAAAYDDAIDLALGDPDQGAGELREEQWVVRDLPIAAKSRLALLDGVSLDCCRALFARRRGPWAPGTPAAYAPAGPAPQDLAGDAPSAGAAAGTLSVVVSGREFVGAEEGGCS